MTAAPRVPPDVPGWTTGLARATSVELEKAVGPRAGRSLLIASAVLGLAAALAMAFTVPAEDRTFALTSFYVQSTISLPLPFVSILLMTQDFGRRALSRTLERDVPVGRTVAAKLLASVIIAIGAAGYGIVLSVLTTSLLPPAAEGRWQGAGMIMLGSVLVQLVAQLCGAGFGLLLMSSAAAIVADVLVPLGLWIITGAVVSLHGLQAWLTPFSAVAVLLSGYMDAQRWAQVGVVVLVWVVTLNVAGMLRLHRLTGASAMSAHVG
jgi:ABC-2 type transport system permease protein